MNVKISRIIVVILCIIEVAADRGWHLFRCIHRSIDVIIQPEQSQFMKFSFSQNHRFHPKLAWLRGREVTITGRRESSPPTAAR